MKVLKIVLFIIAVLFVLYIVVCFAGPKKLEISRSIAINATPESVFGEISNYERWKVWAPWSRRDPDMKSTITGTPASVGYKMTWASKTQGDGEQEFIEVIPNQKVRSSLKFKGWEGVSFSDMVLVPEGEGTIVNWTMDGGEVPFLLRGIMFFLGAVEALEKDYDEGLSGLKNQQRLFSMNPHLKLKKPL
ncbi:MAG: SRPBCC family protein [Crocinitomicaceae bacterium]|nr:SRPBCC family protein [Crocinitomicaceae bacterium]